MKTSAECLEKIKFFEGYEDKAYLDSVGIPTCGYGHTRGVKLGDTCTPELAEQWLIQDITPDEGMINHILVNVPTQCQFDALVSFTYNLGIRSLMESTLLKLFNDNKIVLAAAEFTKWNHAGGKVLPGLTARREWEQYRFLGIA